jgi:hypothetical protein
MKCPYCGKRRSRIRPKLINSKGLLIQAIDCRNAKCKAYNPIAYGYRADMLPEHHQTYHKYKHLIERESDI